MFTFISNLVQDTKVQFHQIAETAKLRKEFCFGDPFLTYCSALRKTMSQRIRVMRGEEQAPSPRGNVKDTSTSNFPQTKEVVFYGAESSLALNCGGKLYCYHAHSIGVAHVTLNSIEDMKALTEQYPSLQWGGRIS